MSSRRLLKAAEAVREVVSMAILTSVRDPRVKDVTVTRVEMAPDMKSAVVHVSVMGGAAKQQLALRGLASSAGFLQSRIADRIETRYTPRLTFKLDEGVRHSIEISRMLDELLPAETAGQTGEPSLGETGEPSLGETGEPSLGETALEARHELEAGQHEENAGRNP